MTERTIHVLAGQRRAVVTRIRPQHNASFEDAAQATEHARRLAQDEGTLLLVHHPSGQVTLREDYTDHPEPGTAQQTRRRAMTRHWRA